MLAACPSSLQRKPGASALLRKFSARTNAAPLAQALHEKLIILQSCPTADIYTLSFPTFATDEQPMKYSTYVFLAMMAFSAAPAMAFDSQQYDECVLQYLRNAKSGQASDMIVNACRKLYKEGAFLQSDERTYQACLLQNLPGVENDQAAQYIAAACQRRSQQ
ncbi:VF_A0006 family four-cysteine protein [Collimonas pratensis]|nr:VF_A0006 family four-cysteine protein [Collimonas pratensis]